MRSILFILFPLAALAQESATERVYRYSTANGQEARTVVRDVSINDGIAQTGFQQIQLQVGVEQPSTSTISYYRSGDIYQRNPVSDIHRESINQGMNQTFMSVGSDGRMKIGMVLPIPPALQQDLHGNQQAYARPTDEYFHQQAQQAARQGQIDKQRENVEKAKVRVDQTRAYLALSAYEALNASNDFVQSRFGQISTPRLTEIRMNAEAQSQQRDAFDVAQSRGDYVRAAMIASELGSPLLLEKSPETQNWLRHHSDQNINSRSVPHFTSPELEHDRGATLKILDSTMTAHPELQNNRKESWVRAALYLIQAAGVAQARGDTNQASLLLARANTIARFLAGVGRASGVTIGQNETLTDSTGAMSQSYQLDPSAVTHAARNTLLGEMGVHPANDIAQYSALITQLQKTSSADAQPYLQLANQALSQKDSMDEAMKAIVEVSVDTAVGMYEKTSLHGLEKALLEGDRPASLLDFLLLHDLRATARVLFTAQVNKYADKWYLDNLPPDERAKGHRAIDNFFDRGREASEGLLMKYAPEIAISLKALAASEGKDLAGRDISNLDRAKAAWSVIKFARQSDLPELEERYSQLLDSKGKEIAGAMKEWDIDEIDYSQVIPIPKSQIEEVQKGIARANLRAQNLGLNATPIYSGSGAAELQGFQLRYDMAHGNGSFQKAYGDNFNSFTVLLNRNPEKVTFVRFEDGKGNAVGPIIPRAAVEGRTMKELALGYPSLRVDDIKTVTPIDLRGNDVVTIVNPRQNSFDGKGSFSEFGTTVQLPVSQPRMFNRNFDFKPDANGRVQFDNLEAKP